MRIKDISVPEIYKSSADFRFFLKWFELALQRVKYDTENIVDLYDPLRCPEQLLWMLGETMGYKYDDRLSPAFNRLALLYFMSMIRHKGSKDGVTLAAEVNLAQFNLNEYGKENAALKNRLEDTSLPVNSVYVTPHTEQGYIEVVYFSEKKPIDACVEYVRPLGMYLFQHEGVRYDGRVKISVDARLTNTNELTTSIGPTRVGHYSRADYASVQRGNAVLADDRELDGRPYNPLGTVVQGDMTHTRKNLHLRNSVYETEVQRPVPSDDGATPPYSPQINAGYRALYSLQLSNNEHIVKANLPHIFDIGFGPENVDITYSPSPVYGDKDYGYRERAGTAAALKPYNLGYRLGTDEAVMVSHYNANPDDLRTIDKERTASILKPRPAVNPPMATIGDAISMPNIKGVPEPNGVVDNTVYTKTDKDGTPKIVPADET